MLNKVILTAGITLSVIIGLALIMGSQKQIAYTTLVRATPTVTPQPTTTPAPMMDIKLAFVALNDNGKHGPKIGCGDSIMYVTKQIPKTQETLRAALNELFAVKTQYYGESGLYNALYQSDLQIDSLSIKDGTAYINLKGQYALGGVCDNPRFEQQIIQTAVQFPTVKKATVTIKK